MIGRFFTIVWIGVAAALLTACRMEMREQPRFEPYEANTFFADGATMRQPVADTVARGQFYEDELRYTGLVNGRLAESFPYTPTVALIERGQERYDIFCTPCHGLTGDGKGIITTYGMPEAPSFHDPDLRAEPPGFYFDVITNGTRVMPSYERIPVDDRWAIIAYVRALQLSQNVEASTLSADELPLLENSEVITQ
jgi:mono/diheme cytochrome c family protein